MAHDSPGFYFNVQKWRSSRAVQRMSFAERGVYLEMMLEQWDKRTLPDHAGGVADLIAPTEAHAAEIEAAWEVVRRKFVASEREPGRIYNVPLERTRRQQSANFRKRRAAGRVGGKASATKRQETKEIPLNESLSTRQRSSTEKSRGEGEVEKEQNGSEQRGREQMPAPVIDARSKRPIFSGQKLTVFEWMLDDCMKTLGTFTDAFDLHAWFFELDGLALRANLVIPKRDGGAWLASQLLAEIRRRDLPITVATVEPTVPTNKRIAGLMAGGEAFLNRRRG